MDEKVMLVMIMTTIIGAVGGYLGTLMLSKRMSLVGGPLGHLAIPGITLALLYGFDVSIGAFGMLLIGVLMIWWLERKTDLPTEVLTAVVFTVSVAGAFLFLSLQDVEIALIGDVSQITWQATLMSVIGAGLVGMIVRKIYKEMVLIMISEDLARVEGIKVERVSLIYLIAVAVVVGLGIRIVGGLLTAAIVSIPAATSRNVSRGMKEYAYGGMIAGGLAGVIGVAAWWLWSVPVGVGVILASGGLFLGSIGLKKRSEKCR